jgi:hypothetical protein
MGLLQQSKEPLYSVMNNLLDTFGESVKKATQHVDFRARVAPHIADLFAGEIGSNELLEICQLMLSGYEKGIYKLEDLYEFRDLMVQLEGRLLKEQLDTEESIDSLHEAVGRILRIGLYGEHVTLGAAELRDKNLVAASAIAGYMQREE